MTDYPVPQKAGLYWARWSTDPNTKLIVKVIGETPFLKGRVWSLDTTVTYDLNPKLIVWGPEIVTMGDFFDKIGFVPEENNV